jgi:hypothetical protein
MTKGLAIVMFCVSVALLVVSVGLAIKADVIWYSEFPVVCSWIAASINVHSFIRLANPIRRD